MKFSPIFNVKSFKNLKQDGNSNTREYGYPGSLGDWKILIHRPLRGLLPTAAIPVDLPWLINCAPRGSWEHEVTLDYMSQKYHIVASCNCKDQIGTDFYMLWGGYWNQAYRPFQHTGPCWEIFYGYGICHLKAKEEIIRDLGGQLLEIFNLRKSVVRTINAHRF